ncbi:hypothetical protein ACPV6E_04890 [Corynebacterium propinquum]|uniref:Uncharacterized protein n=1 Tax=Corynebacterium propinquum TaxID=43769 RepID=A0AAP4FBL6_9CORY|nr:hypothetical protein [Corynebacterium propinquum]MDK4327026.1 hypothetical protein [Corynebacterium propinquum]UQV59602.1 hypothetical protein L9H28_07250 [Corynebacterium propinquum]WKS34831.1 hypothetical protein NLL50_03520 [Corynebacterium propinquum]WKS41313.1 hypothetical protein NLL41_03535 [Corynebacterium propinquum]
MLNKRVLAAAIMSASLIAPVVSPAAHAQNVTMQPGESQQSQVSVLQIDPVKEGATKITGRIGLQAPEETVKITALLMRQVHLLSTSVSKSSSDVPELVEFEIMIPSTHLPMAGDQIQIGPAGEPTKQQVITVLGSDSAEQQTPAPQPLPEPNPAPNTPAPGGDDSKPGADQKPEDGQQDSKPESGQKPEGDQPKPEGEKPKPEGDQKPEGETPGAGKKPEAPKGPENTPKDPKLPGDNGKNPEVDKDMLQGSSTIGDLFKILAALGGATGLISGVVKLLTLGSGSANFVQSIRDFFAQFNIKF